MSKELQRTIGVGNIAGAMMHAALDYGTRGWRVVPLAGGGRVPLVDLARIATEPPAGRDQVAHWWQVWPYAALGIATGHASRLVVVSVPRDVNQARSRAQLTRLVKDASRNESRLGGIPKTAIVAHPSRRHHYFMAPEASIPTCDVGDTRIFGEAGVVLAPPPSIYSDAPLWERSPSTVDLPVAPDWIAMVAAVAPRIGSRVAV
jgi:hypothetical protein